jgi:hypothetical protein
MGSIIDPLAQGWYDDPTGRHELRWFSAGSPTALVRDAGRESMDVLSVEERALPATAGPGLMLPVKSEGVDGQPGPVAWWDTAVPRPGEPTIADIGLDGLVGYGLIREARLLNRMGPRRSRWLPVAVGLIGVLVLLTLFVLFG